MNLDFSNFSISSKFCEIWLHEKVTIGLLGWVMEKQKLKKENAEKTRTVQDWKWNKRIAKKKGNWMNQSFEPMAEKSHVKDEEKMISSKKIRTVVKNFRI